MIHRNTDYRGGAADGGLRRPVYFIRNYQKKKIYVDMADDLLILWNQADEGLQAAESGRDMPMLNIAVCDDEVVFSGKLETMLLAIAAQEHMVVDIDVFTGGAELVDAIYSGETSYDMVFLDIGMGGMDGLEAARQIRKKDELLLLIYVTSFESYAIEAYEVQPFQFMIKPVRMDKLHCCFRKACDKIALYPAYYQYRYQKQDYRLPIQEIMYFSSKKRVILIHMADGTVYQYYDKMGVVEERLKKAKADFWRIHQSYLVNGRYIYRVSLNHVKLTNHGILSISEDRRKNISELYFDRLEDEAIV